MSGQEICVGDQLIVQPAVGLVKFLQKGTKRALLAQATAGITYTTSDGEQKRLHLSSHQVSYALSRDSIQLSVADDALELTWHLIAGEETHLRLEARNITSKPVQVEEFRVLDVTAQLGASLGLASPPRKWRFYQNGWQSWTPAFARHVADGIWVNPNTEDYRTKHQPHALPGAEQWLSSEWFTVLVSGSASSHAALLLGFITTAHQLAEIRLQAKNNFESLQAISYADGYLLSPGEKLSSETLLLAANDAPLALLDLYAKRLGERMQARVPSQAPTGWCTWYYFFGEETAADVLANMAVIQEEHLPLDVILIDDGYETSIGDWFDVDRSKYPDGMKSIVQRIKTAGFCPGIWTAPFGASSASKLYASHPDWVLRDERGDPLLAWQHWGVDIYALDLSMSPVQAWLQNTFHTLAEDWGFEFFKIDFLFAAALPGAHRGGHMTRAQALRRGLEIIRSAIGDRFLLGCGAPLGPSVGIMDAMRIGPDVNVAWQPFWQDLSAPAASNAMLNSICRSFSHRRLWLNDPDCLLLRPRGHESNLVLNEMRMLTTAIGLTGGLVLDSDHLPVMRRGRLKYLRRILPPYAESAIPVDLFEHERPGLLALPIETSWGSWTVVALLNWGDHSCVTTLDFSALHLPSGSYHVYNYWRQRYLGVRRNEVVIKPHQPHEAVLLLLKPVSNRPQLLTSTFHVTQGAVEIRDVRLQEDRLVVEMEKAGMQFGRLLFVVPSGYSVVKALVNGQPQRPRQISPSIWQVGFSLSGRATVELLFG